MTDVEVLSKVRAHEFPDDWYELSDSSHFWFRWRLAALERLLEQASAPRGPEVKALDVGCGSGVLAAQLEASQGWTVDATDLNLPALERCAPRRGRTLYYDVTDERPELLAAYDVVSVFDVLEHLDEPHPLVKSSLRHLKEGGFFLVNVPAHPALMSEYDRAAGHVRRYTRSSLAAELAETGLKTLALRYWGLALVPLLAARKVMLSRPGPDTIKRGFRPPSALVNRGLVELMRVETALVRSPPAGSSVMYVGTKLATPARASPAGSETSGR